MVLLEVSKSWADLWVVQLEKVVYVGLPVLCRFGLAILWTIFIYTYTRRFFCLHRNDGEGFKGEAPTVPQTQPLP